MFSRALDSVEVMFKVPGTFYVILCLLVRLFTAIRVHAFVFGKAASRAFARCRVVVPLVVMCRVRRVFARSCYEKRPYVELGPTCTTSSRSLECACVATHSQDSTNSPCPEAGHGILACRYSEQLQFASQCVTLDLHYMSGVIGGACGPPVI